MTKKSHPHFYILFFSIIKFMFGWDGGGDDDGGGVVEENWMENEKQNFIDKEIAFGRKKNVIMISMDTILCLWCCCWWWLREGYRRKDSIQKI